MKILEGLNPAQREAAVDYAGPSFVIACPGAGKTRVLVARTAFMLKSGVDPSNILLFTFTRKASEEIKDRIKKVIDADIVDHINVGTYHSICLALLRKYHTYLGYKQGFTIYDDSDSKSLLKKAAKATGVTSIEELKNYIDYNKAHLLGPVKALEKDGSKPLSLAYQMYQDVLFRSNAMDFDDLIFNTIRLLESNHPIRGAVQKKFQYIMVDEFHDSSPRDIRLINLLCKTGNVCYILDNDQSIYGFRGSDIGAVFGLKEKLEPKIHLLEQNYRSTGNIVRAARKLISNNKEYQFDKVVYTENPTGEMPLYFEHANAEKEAEFTVKTIMFLKRKGLEYKDMCILYRVNNMSIPVEHALIKAGIPYRIFGGMPFYNRKEVKDLASYIKLIVNPYDTEAFLRAINTPKRGIGPKTIEQILDRSRQMEDSNLIEACKSTPLPKKASEAVNGFAYDYEQMIAQVENLEPFEALENIIEIIKYRKYLDSDPDVGDRIENIEQLIKMAGDSDSMEEFLDLLTINSYDEEEDDHNYVNLMSMHRSKGLEYRAIIIVGVYEGAIPHFRSSEIHNIEEERRLFYVAMTRAEEYLFIMRPKFVLMNNQRTFPKESRFINEIKDVIKRS